jgi:hypothetical protein
MICSWTEIIPENENNIRRMEHDFIELTNEKYAFCGLHESKITATVWLLSVQMWHT